MSWHSLQELGGGILGGHLLGWNTVCAVEIEEYPRNVLLQRQRDGILPPFPIWDDVCTFDGTPWRGLVDVVSGGFPCQDISAAGKGAGITGTRSGLWREMHRIICEIRPRYAFLENSPMLTSRGLGVVLGDLAEAGYHAAWCVYGAVDVGAPHHRKRIWILAEDSQQRGLLPHPELHWPRWWQQEPPSTPSADSESSRDLHHAGCIGRNPQQIQTGIHGKETAETQLRQPHGADCSPNPVPNSDLQRGGRRLPCTPSSPQRSADGCLGNAWWASEPNVGRVAHGVAFKVDRLKSIGNGQVPLVAATAFLKLTHILNQTLNIQH